MSLSLYVDHFASVTYLLPEPEPEPEPGREAEALVRGIYAIADRSERSQRSG
jgi:hypothetical protein